MAAVRSAMVSGQQRLIQSYLALAKAITTESTPVLVITHGVSGSGKSHLARRLACRLGWIRLRSDVERKRLFGLWGLPVRGLTAREVRSGDLYAAEVTEQLFGNQLPQCAEAILGAGLSLIVDATFLDRRHRLRFADLADRCGVRFVILDCRCSPELARRRLSARQAVGLDPSDADLAVLERQLELRDPLERSELASTLVAEASDADGCDGVDRPDLSLAAGQDDQDLLERLAAALMAAPAPD